MAIVYGQVYLYDDDLNSDTPLKKFFLNFERFENGMDSLQLGVKWRYQGKLLDPLL